MKRENGLVFASYLIWGLLPIFWKQLSMVNSAYVLASRIIWSAIFCGALLLLRHRWSGVKLALADKKEARLIFLCAILISINWGLYIFSIAIGKVLESSLAYYMSPIISVLIGAVFFREKHGVVQWLAIAIATIGVLIAVVMYGSVPWLALTIGASFAVYGALKKKVKADGETSIFLETLFMAPFALAFMVFAEWNGNGVLGVLHGWQFVLLPLTGIVTSVPLMLFAQGIKQTSITLSGILMYINPTLVLLLGVFLYGEEFTRTNQIVFVFVWAAVLLFVGDNLVQHHRAAKKLEEPVEP